MEMIQRFSIWFFGPELWIPALVVVALGFLGALWLLILLYNPMTEKRNYLRTEGDKE
jgi:hypothetical protein